MIKESIKNLIYPCYENLKTLINKERINVLWWKSHNWGDALNPVLVQYLSGLKPFRVHKYIKNPKNEPIYTVIGSILDWVPLENNKILKNTVIWGTGFISENGRLQGKPKQICAIRGPLSRENILKTGISCPEIYGDPALLYSKIYRPDISKKYKLGIIPHFVDKKNILLKKFEKNPEIKLIDIEGPINSVVDQVCSCKYIASSSLHGIIVADAYDIPALYIKLSENIIGEGFKFKDYFGSVGQSETKPLVISKNTTEDDIYDGISKYKIDINLNELLDACPFNNRNILK